MYKVTIDTIYRSGISYYSLSGSTYTLLVAGTDYVIGNAISGTIYNFFAFDKVYVNGIAFPYTPVHDAGQNDVDLDSYTNTSGKTVRNRIRSDVKTLDFNLETMSGQEMKDLMTMRKPVWFKATFFDESEWDVITRTMYCSSPKYTKYFIHQTDPLKNIYTSVSFGFVEE